MLLVSITVLFALISSCTAFAVEPIKIGYLATLTGDHAAYGQTELNMAKFVVLDVNAKGGVLGRPIELVPYDAKASNEDAVDAVKRMIDFDKVVAIVGANSSAINIATAPIVDDGKVPQISTAGTNKLVTVYDGGKVRPYSFRLCSIDSYQGLICANLARTILKKDKAAILYDAESEYAIGLRGFFVKEYRKLAGKIVADESYREGDTDFRTHLTAVKNSGANILFLPGMGSDMALIIKQAREMNLTDLAIVGGDGYGDFMNGIAGDAMKGTYWVTHAYYEERSMAPVFARYKQVYNEECKEFVSGTIAYDAMYWLVDAIKRAGEADGPAIAKALEKTKRLKLNHAVLTIDPTTHNPVNKSGIILKVDNDLKAKFFRKVQPK